MQLHVKVKDKGGTAPKIVCFHPHHNESEG